MAFNIAFFRDQRLKEVGAKLEEARRVIDILDCEDLEKIESESELLSLHLRTMQAALSFFRLSCDEVILKREILFSEAVKHIQDFKREKEKNNRLKGESAILRKVEENPSLSKISESTIEEIEEKMDEAFKYCEEVAPQIKKELDSLPKILSNDIEQLSELEQLHQRCKSTHDIFVLNIQLLENECWSLSKKTADLFLENRVLEEVNLAIKES